MLKSHAWQWRASGEARLDNEKSIATIVIKAPGKMTAAERKDIATWLRRHAEHLLKHGKEYTEGRFTGRYIAR